MFDEPRQEFGRARSACHCTTCKGYCRTVPGMLIPSDLQRLIPPEADPLEWAEEHLLASPGAIVARRDQPFNPIRIATLVPRTDGSGACHWFDHGTQSCKVWACAPFGCAFFAHDTTKQEGDAISLAGLRTIAQDWHDAGPYSVVWAWLDLIGHVAEDPAIKRAKETA